MNSRAIAAKALAKILRDGKNLDDALSTIESDKAFIQMLCYGVCRYFFTLEAISNKLLKKSLNKKDTDVLALILMGLYQLRYLDTKPFAAINECVSASKQLKKPWASGLINATLRNFQRNQEALLKTSNNVEKYAHPSWLISQLQSAWPTQWQSILEHNNVKPPMTLRVNQQKTSRADYLQQLLANDIEASAGLLSNNSVQLATPINVQRLPQFSEGFVSVQDEAAQLAAEQLELQEGQRVLDACAAPGGKACHLLEVEKNIQLTALDNNEKRCQRIHENLARLQLSANVLTADASDITAWWNGEKFDRILLDAPCSATGVIRRHPDIKILRRATDIKALTQTQEKLLTSLWRVLNNDGIMLYATCSLLPDENENMIESFLQSHSDASVLPLKINGGVDLKFGKQFFPNPTDGFYYAKLTKQG